MKVLITGGTGVNGAATSRLLVSEGMRPVLMDNRMDLSLIGDIKDKVDLLEGDVTDFQALEKMVADYRITHIAHLAALMPEPAEENPRLAMRVGVDGTLNILEVARAHKISRIVFTSSKAVYGEMVGDFGEPRFLPVTEDHPKRPADLYGVIKVCCEELGQYYWETYGVEFVALRFSTIYGPGKEARHGALSFYGQLIEKTQAGEPWVIPQGGDQRNDAVYVGDVARSIFLALKAENLNRWVFNVGTGRGSTPREFLAVLKSLFPNEPLYDVDRGVRDYVNTIMRLRA
ncbi:MAG: NAD-dependent epimerase/dehydratase family protein [Candidatus Tectomicrobia bacterium]|uniref:NAD-dependent epimerase/dehydratase family protein n=1 Tax=Tectimicrobiota bacterium TaxID=2528274 RepID=A0A932M229_UNCTE|nr:NAD-dependent epimerase/dehydratase family protein [Candidatus Tectomicrobia bacterium]